MAQVALQHVSKVYPDGTSAVSDLDLAITDGEFLVLVGPSGCGKTTALRMVAGLEEITSGAIVIGDRVVNDVPPRDRDVAMVFQSYALYPHLTVEQNIGFGLSLRKVDKAEIRRRVRDAADVLGLADLLGRKPRNLSGGQRQRVAMGRAIVRQPQVFLMDEPLSNLDAKLRVQMRAEIARLQLKLGVTTIYVTHDQTEAMTLGDRVAVMNNGVLQQVAPPQELYDRPVNVFVGGFIGSPAMNLLEGRFEEDGRSLVLGSHRLPVDDTLLVARPAIRSRLGAPVIVGIRPEDMFDAELAPGQSPAVLEATAELVEAMGSDVMVHFSLDVAPAVNEEIVVARELDATHLVPSSTTSAVIARFNPRTAAKQGKALRVGVDTKRLHVFDRESGRAVWD